jgi:hypothetical protein
MTDVEVIEGDARSTGLARRLLRSLPKRSPSYGRPRSDASVRARATASALRSTPTTLPSAQPSRRGARDNRPDRSRPRPRVRRALSLPDRTASSTRAPAAGPVAATVLVPLAGNRERTGRPQSSQVPLPFPLRGRAWRFYSRCRVQAAGQVTAPISQPDRRMPPRLQTAAASRSLTRTRH